MKVLVPKFVMKKVMRDTLLKSTDSQVTRHVTSDVSFSSTTMEMQVEFENGIQIGNMFWVFRASKFVFTIECFRHRGRSYVQSN